MDVNSNVTPSKQPTPVPSPPKPPVQPNVPPVPPASPTQPASRLTPPTPPNASATQSAPQQQPSGTHQQQPGYTTPPTPPNGQNNVQSNIDNFLANAKKFDIKDLIELKSKPEYNLGNFIGQTFCSFWRFDTCSTRYDWWLGQVILLILMPTSGVLNQWYYASRHTIVDQDGPNPLLILISVVLAVYAIVAELALTIRRLHDSSTSPWILLFPLVTIPANFVAGAIAFIIGPLMALILVAIVGLVGALVPVIILGFTPPLNIINDEPRYMVFHWDKLLS